MPPANSPLANALESLTEALRPFVKAMQDFARQMSNLAARLRERANDPVRVAGLCARYQVRAGLDPFYAHPGHLDALVRSILDGTVADDPLAALLTPESRREVATAALRGWAQRHPDSGPYVLHRLWGHDRVEVSCG